MSSGNGFKANGRIVIVGASLAGLLGVPVNEPELATHHCCRLVAAKNGHWQLTPTGEQHLQLLVY